MKLHQHGFGNINELVVYANEKGLTKDGIVSIIRQESGTYILVYFDED